MDKKGWLSGPAQMTLIKWVAVIIILVIVLYFVKDMWEKLVQDPILGVAIIIGILVLIFGGSLTIGRLIRVFK